MKSAQKRPGERQSVADMSLALVKSRANAASLTFPTAGAALLLPQSYLLTLPYPPPAGVLGKGRSTWSSHRGKLRAVGGRWLVREAREGTYGN